MPLFDREVWADVVPVAQDDGPSPIAAIMYSDNYKEMMGFFRAAISSGERSDRVLDLTKAILAVNAANYTVWQYRRVCLFELSKDLIAELDFMDTFSDDNPKNYQIWHHRRVVAEKSREGKRELDFTTRVFALDAKNYHGWAHRQWVLKEFQLWDGELAYIDELLAEDVRNNSAWNQRWFVIRNGPTPFTIEVFHKEVNSVLWHISLAKNNESSWNYLRGLVMCSPTSLVGIEEKKDILVKLKEDCASVDESENSCRHLYALTAELSENLGGPSDMALADELLNKLANQFDCIREKYWNCRLDRLRNRIPIQFSESSLP